MLVMPKWHNDLVKWLQCRQTTFIPILLGTTISHTELSQRLAKSFSKSISHLALYEDEIN